MAAVETYVPRLKAHYKNVVREELIKELGVKNVMQVPNLEKIVINMGVGRATQQSSLIDGAVADLTAIITKSRTSIASFKLRENQAIGAKVTLRGDRMWEFFDRLISVAIPRIRDFRGLPGKSWDGNGNYTFGLTEQLVFLEVSYEKVDTTRGMDITIVTSAKTDLEGKALLDAFGFPFRKGEMPASTKKSRGATKRSLKK
jgi:large subunit ribosomal protein L5